MSYFQKSSRQISLKDTKEEVHKLQGSIKDLLYILGDEGENIMYSEDPDEKFLIRQYSKLTDKLDDIYRRLEYLAKDIVTEGMIFHNSAGRYELLNGDYFTSGSIIEILVKPKYEDEENKPYWVLTTVEHNGDDYYAVALGKETSINGMTVRLRR